MTKYKQVFDLMLTQNKDLFDQFKLIHDQYTKDPEGNQAQFNEIGRDIQDVIRRYENILCGKSESSGYGKFSNSLADKFHTEIKKEFPKIDHIGEE